VQNSELPGIATAQGTVPRPVVYSATSNLSLGDAAWRALCAGLDTPGSTSRCLCRGPPVANESD
jgi:hypothetical protein